MTSPLPPTTAHVPHQSVFARRMLEAQRLNAKARLRRYGLTSVEVSFRPGAAHAFALTGGTATQRQMAMRLLAD